MKIFRLLAVMCLGAGLAACEDPSGSEKPVPEPTTLASAGVYRLRVLNGRPLPVQILDNRGRAMATFLNTTLTLNPDSTYRWTQDRGSALLEIDSVGVVKALSDSVLQVGGRAATVRGGVLMIEACWATSVCTFVREGTDAGPALTYRRFSLDAADGQPLKCCGDVVSGTVWLWGDGRFQRHMGNLLPNYDIDAGTYQLSGTNVALTITQPVSDPFGFRPPTGTLQGNRLTLGRYGYAESPVP